MNKPQKLTLIAGLIIIALMALFPPWHLAPPNGFNFGYHFLLSPPSMGATVHLARLATQILLVAAVCAALWLLFKSDP